MNHSRVSPCYFGCPETFEILLSNWIQMCMTIKSVLDIPCFLSNAVLIMTQFFMQSYDWNIRLLISNTSLACMITSALQWIRHLTCATTSYDDYCSRFAIGRYECRKETMVELSTFAFLFCSTGCIVLERAVASRWHNTYDQGNHWKLLGIILCASCWLCSWLYYFAELIANEPEDANVVSFCLYPFAGNVRYIFGFMCVPLASKVAAVFIFYWILWTNRKRLVDFALNQAQFNLTSRLQLKHSVELAEVLIPTVVTHTLTWMVLETCGLMVLLLFESRVVEQVQWLMILNVFVAIQGIMFPAIIFHKHDSLKRKFRHIVRLLMKRCMLFSRGHSELTSIARFKDAEVIEHGDLKTHYRNLQNLWEQKALSSPTCTKY